MAARRPRPLTPPAAYVFSTRLSAGALGERGETPFRDHKARHDAARAVPPGAAARQWVGFVHEAGSSGGGQSSPIPLPDLKED